MKLISLTQGQFAQVDDEDFEWLSQWKWLAQKDDHTYYACRSIRKNKRYFTIKMHREIMKTPRELEVDHIDHNGLNNQRHNLRNCTRSENCKNHNTHSLTGYLGVSFYDFNRKKSKPYRATIWVNGGNIHLGTFATAKEAAIAYNNAAIKYHGEFANLNTI